MKEFWNERFEKDEYIYGDKPNAFLKYQLDNIKTRGKALFPLEGEGRNACYASFLGWEVEAFDFSKPGQQKAKQLCKKHNVNIDYFLSTAEEFDFLKETYDLVVLVYAHLNPDVRPKFHQNIVESLKPGGQLIMEAFHPKQLIDNYTSGGPKNKEMLYTLEMLKEDFQNMTSIDGKELEIHLGEGEHHNGNGFVTRLTGVK